MSKCRGKKRTGIYFIGMFMLFMVFCIPVAAGVAEKEGEYDLSVAAEFGVWKRHNDADRSGGCNLWRRY